MQKIINFWKEHATKDLVAIINKMTKAELEEAFEGELKFGTAGIRDIIGPGPKLMNIYNVMKITYGFAKYLLAKHGSPSKIGVIIGTDNRYKKEDFSRVATGILTQMGIKVMKSLVVPTPLVAFTIKKVNAQGGMVITASHNPPNYNGIKLYDQNGGQLLPEATTKILDFANQRSEYLTYPYRENRMAIMPIPQPIINEYLLALKKVGFQSIKNHNLKIVFSPLHGTSATLMPQLLSEIGYQVIPVKEQMDPDPAFTNTPDPNPEALVAYEIGLKYLQASNADLMFTTDPDGDRIGVMAKKDQKWKMLTGNQIALIIFEYLIMHKPIIANQSTLIYSYVSTPLALEMAKQNKIKAVPIATGFKWATKVINELKAQNFFFAFEESHGYLIDANICYEKDAFQAAVIISEIAQKAKNDQETLWDVLAKIYQKYGFVKEKTISKTFKNHTSFKKQDQFMAYLRKEGLNLIKKEGKMIDLQKGLKNVESMNLIKFKFSYGQVMIRPSGTEPKIKLYLQVWTKEQKKLKQNWSFLENFVKKLLINFK